MYRKLVLILTMINWGTCIAQCDNEIDRILESTISDQFLFENHENVLFLFDSLLQTCTNPDIRTVKRAYLSAQKIQTFEADSIKDLARKIYPIKFKDWDTLRLTPKITSVNLNNPFTGLIDEKHEIVDEMPEYPGGMKAFYKHISKKLHYPKVARDKRIEGKVYIRFIVETDGQVSNISVSKGLDEECDQEAIRVMKLLPKKFTPGRIKGTPTRVVMFVPIFFKLKE